MIKVTVWNEFRHEHVHEEVREVYPDGLHRAIAEGLEQEEGLSVRTATLPEPEHGLTQEALDDTDVLIWWGHMAHHEVEDEIVERVHRRVLEGMGLVVLHSGHFSKIFKKLMGTSCDLKWREAKEKERIWVVDPAHPIAAGLPEFFEIKPEEMYGEHFDIPAPDELVFISWFEGGEVFRSGCTYKRGQGKIFYFRPGHETYPTYYHPLVRRVIANGVRWAAPSGAAKPVRGNHKPLESLG
ncbi:ThuA domain-containing protein [Cohnella thailandensis]|uniref:ThuA domain-containing protein n=1 Tax=Cohnella thailandensis TaxID=557557 RepID=A0A841SJM1_9BACL|nr:ThuA domain-containing protein [Cohnella thailandensis]MBB6632713.1 ThuA domain-containing protein [Cohnella thailandensis]MBP1975598.1 trehalose utilization protein [Cohnella thailandensis]